MPGFYLLGGGGGGQGGSFPPKMSIFPPKHFHKIWQNTTEQLSYSAINFLSASNKLQSSKLCHRLSINRSC